MKFSTCILGGASFGALIQNGAGASSMWTNPSRKTKQTDRSTIGLAINGGGFTTANVGGSIMRGLQQHKVQIYGEDMTALEAFDFVSGISGGCFPVILHAFNKKFTTDELLDVDGIVEPSEITDEALSTMPEESMFNLYATSSKFAIEKALKAMGEVNKTTPEDFALADFTGFPFWQAFVYFHFIEPIGVEPHKQVSAGESSGSDEYVTPRDDVKSAPILTYSMIGPEELYDDWLHTHQSTGIVEQIKSDLESLPDVAFPAGSAIRKQLPDNSIILDIVKEHHHQVPIPFFSSPDEVHSPYVAGELRFDPVANKTAEPLDFEPFDASTKDLASVTTGLYSVEKYLALATNLMPHIGNQVRTQAAGLAQRLQGTPYQAFAPALIGEIEGGVETISDPTTLLDVPTKGGDKRSMAFADGGYNDGTGILALLKMKVHKIISVVAITPNQFDNNPAKIDDAALKAIEYMAEYFGQVNIEKLNRGNLDVAQDFSSYVFDPMSNGEDQLEKMYSTLKAQYEEGNPMIVTLEDLTVVENPFWGTVAGEKVDLTLIWVLGVPEKFSMQVPHDAAPPSDGKNFTEHGFFTNENLSLVPNVEHRRPIDPEALGALLPTLPPALPQAVLDELTLEFGLDTKETRMTNFLGSWIVQEAWDGLAGSDGETLFGGFKSMLEYKTELTEAPTEASAAPTMAPVAVNASATTKSPTAGEIATKSDESAGTNVFSISVMWLTASSAVATILYSLF